MKSGRAPAAPRPDSSQTRALLAASDTHVDALFRYAEVIRTDSLGEMFDLAGLLARQPPPRGDRRGRRRPRALEPPLPQRPYAAVGR